MAYRRTERVLERLAARREDIILAARDTAAEHGLAAVQIVPVAERAGIAAGTVYRYFPAKADLVEAVLEAIRETELAAIRTAAAAAPGPLSALAAAVMTLATRAVQQPGLVSAALAPRPGAETDDSASGLRRALAVEFEACIGAAIAARHLPTQDAQMSAAGIIGALVECAVGPLSQHPADPADRKVKAQTAALLALRALGVADARARGLVIQVRAVPDHDS